MRPICWLAATALAVASAASKPNPEFGGTAPEREALDVDGPEMRNAIRYVMTELKRLSNQYRYASFLHCHSAEAGAANFDGRNLFLDIEFDMLPKRGRAEPVQPSRHDIILFKDETGVITGMALDEFPEVTFRPVVDPSVD